MYAHGAHTEERWVQVGGFCIMMKDDMKRVAPLWLNFSKKVRHDPDVSHCSSCPVLASLILQRILDEAFIRLQSGSAWLSSCLAFGNVCLGSEDRRSHTHEK